MMYPCGQNLMHLYSLSEILASVTNMAVVRLCGQLVVTMVVVLNVYLTLLIDAMMISCFDKHLVKKFIE